MNNPTKYIGNEIEYLKKVLESENWSSTSGSWNKLLEEALCKKFESNYSVTMNSGTSTLHSALVAVGVKPGDEVISPALTVVMDTTSTIHTGAIPVYADVDSDTFNVSPKEIEKKITPKTKAIIVVHLYGLPCDMDEIMQVANEHQIPVIEDSAECLMSRYNGKIVGSFGSVASYSFENSKHLSCGEGGAVTTNDEHLAMLMRKMSNHGFKNSTARSGLTKLNLDDFQNPEYKRHDEIGWNYRLSEFSAAIAYAQLENIDHLINLRVQASNFYLEAISSTGCDYLIPQMVDEKRDHSYWTFPLLYKGNDIMGVSWQDFRKKYMENGGDGIYAAWSVPYLEPVISERKFVKFNPNDYGSISYEKGLCPVAESIQSRIMQFKTNYRDLDLAAEKADALKRTILYFDRI